MGWNWRWFAEHWLWVIIICGLAIFLIFWTLGIVVRKMFQSKLILIIIQILVLLVLAAVCFKYFPKWFG